MSWQTFSVVGMITYCAIYSSYGQEDSSQLPEVDVKNDPFTPKPSSDERERESELCLSRDEEHVLMSDDVLQCLYSAVEGWEGMWRTITESNISPVSSHTTL